MGGAAGHAVSWAWLGAHCMSIRSRKAMAPLMEMGVFNMVVHLRALPVPQPPFTCVQPDVSCRTMMGADW